MLLIKANPARRPQFISLILLFTNPSLQPPYFSTSSILSAAAPRSPRVRATQRSQQQQPQYQQQTTPNTFSGSASRPQWPTVVFQAASKSGEISISAQAAEAILDDFLKLEGSQSAGGLCSRHGINPSILTQLAKLLHLSSRSSEYPKIAQALVKAASQLKDPAATFLLCEGALRYHGGVVPVAQRQHLKEMVSEHKNCAAMYMQGQIYEAEKRDSVALEMYLRSLDNAGDGYDGSKDFKITLGNVWMGIYRVKKRGKDKEGARVAIRKAALEYDDPTAYFLLAKEFTPESSSEYEEYMTKAAASGEMEAVDALGIYYFKQAQETGSSSSSTASPVDQARNLVGDTGTVSPASEGAASAEKRKGQDLAREWFMVGAEANIPSSQVHLAVILRHEGKLSEGLDWLNKASEAKSWTKTVTWFKGFWESNTVDFMQLDMENLRLSQDGAD